jgi:signal transduction histidine kinase
MLALRRALLTLLALGIVSAGLLAAVTVTSRHEPDKALAVVFGVVVGLSFIGVGLFAWWRRPLNRFGVLMTAVGFAWFLNGLTASNASAIFTIASYLGPLYLALVVHMVLAFPGGRLETTEQRALVIAGYLLVVGVRLPFFLLGGDISSDLEGSRPENVLALTDDPQSAIVFDWLAGFLAAVGLAIAAVLAVRKHHAASEVQRRQRAPMLFTALGVLVLVALAELLVLAGADRAADVFEVAALVGFAGLPYAFLAGLVRSRYSRAGAVGELIERLNAGESGGGSLRGALADALGDPSLQLLYWRDRAGQYVTHAGHPVELPTPGSGRAVTEVERDGERVGAIVHEEQLVDEPELVRMVAGSAALALENERLEAELRARVDELERSRARVMEISLFERRRLERDLHDGAQQRLVALSLQIGMAQKMVTDKPALAARLLESAREELRTALAELRELARGIHPAILTDQGLGPALEALAARTPIPVDLGAMPAERLPASVEAAAYFVVAESLTNVTKYAHAGRASVTIARDDGFAVVEVRDDGIGGADPRAGTGLRGLADRIAALDGHLEVHSPPGEGTIIRANIPCGSS